MRRMEGQIMFLKIIVLILQIFFYLFKMISLPLFLGATICLIFEGRYYFAIFVGVVPFLIIEHKLMLYIRGKRVRELTGRGK